MARRTEKRPRDNGPVYVERVVNLELLNSKLNQITELLYRLAEKNKVSLTEREEQDQDDDEEDYDDD